jgi:hypothetical protein
VKAEVKPVTKPVKNPGLPNDPFRDLFEQARLKK